MITLNGLNEATEEKILTFSGLIKLAFYQFI
jgi:hypothetical protein